MSRFSRGPQAAPSVFYGKVETMTAKAVLFKAHDWPAEEWLPKSQVKVTKLETEDCVEIAAWLVEKNGWEEHGEMNPPAEQDSGSPLVDDADADADDGIFDDHELKYGDTVFDPDVPF